MRSHFKRPSTWRDLRRQSLHLHSILVGSIPAFAVLLFAARGREFESAIVASTNKGREVNVERKYDGQYCQMHIWLDNDDLQWQIRILSKSGRDSTFDRDSILPIVRQCLRLSRSWCKVRRRCILVGEIVVWNSSVQDIMPFYKIRRYVTRKGCRLGYTEDSVLDSRRAPHDRLL